MCVKKLNTDRSGPYISITQPLGGQWHASVACTQNHREQTASILDSFNMRYTYLLLQQFDPIKG